MFKTSGRASFLIILFQFLQYYVFVVFPCDAFDLFNRHFYCDSFTREEDCIQKKPFLDSKNVWQLFGACCVFRGPDLVANLSDGLKKWTQVHHLRRHWQTAFCHILEKFEAAF